MSDTFATLLQVLSVGHSGALTPRSVISDRLLPHPDMQALAARISDNLRGESSIWGEILRPLSGESSDCYKIRIQNEIDLSRLESEESNMYLFEKELCSETSSHRQVVNRKKKGISVRTIKPILIDSAELREGVLLQKVLEERKIENLRARLESSDARFRNHFKAQQAKLLSERQAMKNMRNQLIELTRKKESLKIGASAFLPDLGAAERRKNILAKKVEISISDRLRKEALVQLRKSDWSTAEERYRQLTRRNTNS